MAIVVMLAITLMKGLLLMQLMSKTDSSVIPKVGGVSRTNFGVDFNFLFQINNMHGTWRHAWTVDTSILHRSVPRFGDIKCSANNMLLCNGLVTTALEGSAILWNSTSKFSALHNWMQDPQVLRTLNRGENPHRSKRALLPFIGDIEKFLFGVATESDILSMKATLQDMRKLQGNYADEISQLGENLASVTKATTEDLATTKKGLQVLKNTFQNLTHCINDRFNDVIKDLHHEELETQEVQIAIHQLGIIIVQLFKLSSEVNSLMLAEISMLQGIQQILSGYIPITLIRPEDLQKGLRVAERGVKEVFPTASLSYDDSSIGYYYTHQIVTPIITSDSITLLVDIPVDLEQQILNVYAVRIFPVPLHFNPESQTSRDDASSRALSILRSEHTYFLVSQDGAYYSYAETGDVLLCKGTTIKNCPKQFPLFAMEESSCLQKLWSDSTFKDILETCPYELYHPLHASKPTVNVQVVPLSEGRWYIVSPLNEHWAITCPSRPPESRKSCSSCIVQVNCGCGILSKHFQIPTRVAACTESGSPLKHNYTVNPFSYVKEEQNWSINLTGSDMFPTPIHKYQDIEIPSPANWDDVMESMDRKAYDLNRLYSKQKNETKQFRSSSEAILEKIKTQDQFLQSLAGWPDWVVGLGIGLSFCNSIILGLIIWCFLSKGVHGSPIFSRYEAELPLAHDPSGTLISLDVIMILLLVFNTALLLVLAWPIVSNWIMNRDWMRRASGNLREFKAVGYVRRRSGTNVVLHGILRFSTSSVARSIPVKILLGCLPGGWHLSDPRADRTRCLAEVDGSSYSLTLLDPITIISHADGVTIVDIFALDTATIHEGTNVPLQNRLTSIEEVMVIPEAV